MKEIPYYHVDVFSTRPLSGNGLIVFTDAAGFDKDTMQLLTQEMRQFESVFLQQRNENTFRARIFTCSEELDFAGHPILGAAAILHELQHAGDEIFQWTFELNEKPVEVFTRKKGSSYEASMNQGKATFGKVLNSAETASILDLINASPDDLYPGLYPTVVSTGLPYLIVPFSKNFFKAGIGAAGMEEKLHQFGAKFIGLLDVGSRSIRTGNNDGLMEDIATGSLVGPAGAFLVQHSFEKADTVIQFHQGENLSRSSDLFVECRSCHDDMDDVFVSGSVCKIGGGTLDDSLVQFLEEKAG